MTFKFVKDQKEHQITMIVTCGPITRNSAVIKYSSVSHDDDESLWVGTTKTPGFDIGREIYHSILYIPVNISFRQFNWLRLT